jgi:hypothetical protein
MEAIVAILDASSNNDNAMRRAAETELARLSATPAWPTGLLSIVGEARLPASTRLAAALALKRATYEHWHHDDPSEGASPYPEAVKAAGAWRAAARENG